MFGLNRGCGINSQFGWIKWLGVGFSDSKKRKSDVLASPFFGFSPNSVMLDSIAENT